MSQHDFNLSYDIAYTGSDYPQPPFYAIIMAAMRRADNRNIELLKTAFPETWAEFDRRRKSHLGVLKGEYCPACSEQTDADDHRCRTESVRLMAALLEIEQESAPDTAPTRIKLDGQFLTYSDTGECWTDNEGEAFIFPTLEEAAGLIENFSMLDGAEAEAAPD